MHFLIFCHTGFIPEANNNKQPVGVREGGLLLLSFLPHSWNKRTFDTLTDDLLKRLLRRGTPRRIRLGMDLNSDLDV